MKKIYTFFLVLACGFVLGTSSLRAQTEVTFYTTMGDFVARLYDTIQPITAGNFKTLVEVSFYDGIIFHRVVNGFVIQGGDPTRTGMGGPGYTIPDEFDSRASNIQKSLGMANSGPNTGGSQFYINLVNNTQLDANYPVFGFVISGFSVVQAIGNVSVDTNDRPLTPVRMDSVRITYNFVPTASEAEKEVAKGMEIFPNPLSGESLLRFESMASGTANLQVIDASGKILSAKALACKPGINVIRYESWSGGNLPSGMYWLRLDREGRSETLAVQVP